MYWIRNINDLSYYNTPPNIPCYCNTIINTSDLRLQGILDYNGNLGSYSAEIDLYSVDGLTNYGNIASSFSVSYGKNPNGAHFFNAFLNVIPSLMCSHPCFILRVRITTGSKLYFDYYTDRYCAPSDCCNEVQVVIFEQEGTVQPSPNVVFTGGGGVTPTSRPKTTTDDCAETYVVLETFSDCYNNITEKYYAAIDGKRFTNKYNIKGRLKAIPYEIERTNSLNCRLQKSQIQRLYEIEGYDLYSPEAMDEITAALTDQFIFIDGRRYEIGKTVPFEAVQLPGVCQLYYKLKASLQDCIVKQIFGCGDECTSNQLAFLQPFVIAGDGKYYSEDKNYIGSTVADLKNYYLTYPGVISVTDLDPVDYDCDFVAGFTVESDGYIPTSFYFGGVVSRNRLFGVDPDTLDVCSVVDGRCIMPVLGAITNTIYVCATPVLGAITNTTPAEETLYMTGYGDWALNSNISTRTGNVVQLKFEVENPNITYDSGDPDATIPIVAMVVAYVSEAGWPSTVVNLTDAQAPSLPAGAIVSIRPDGKIWYNGEVTFSDLTSSKVSITDIIYNI